MEPTRAAPVPAEPVPAAPRQADDEIERAKERIRKEAARETEQQKRDIVRDFLPVLDDLDRAVDAARRSGNDTALLEGVELVRKSFLARLARHGIAPYPSLGQRFDPARHDAVNTVPVSDPAQDGVVVGVIREGYLVDGEMLRPALVAVGQLA